MRKRSSVSLPSFLQNGALDRRRPDLQTARRRGGRAWARRRGVRVPVRRGAGSPAGASGRMWNFVWWVFEWSVEDPSRIRTFEIVLLG